MTPDQGTLGLFDAPPRVDIPRPSRYLVEIGPGRHPLPFVEDGIVRKGDRYLGIDDLSMGWWDLVGESFNEVAERVTNLSDTEGDFRIIRGDGKRIPAESGSVDEVFLGNVLGYVGVASVEALALMREAVRVLKKDGILTVLETITPADRRYLSDVLKRLGLDQKNKGFEKDAEKAKQYFTSGFARNEFGYINELAYLVHFGFEEPTSSMWSDSNFGK